jgi:dihydroorotate dehydrogenase
MKACDVEERVGVAAGYAKTKEGAKELVQAGIRRIVLGSNMLQERSGNTGDTFLAGSNGSTWNWRGLPGKALLPMLEEDVAPFILWCDEQGIAVETFVSVAAFSAEELLECVEVVQSVRVGAHTLLVSRLAGLEVNGSCAHTGEVPLAYDAGATYSALKRVCETVELPVGFKLPPYLENCKLRKRVCESALSAGVQYLVTCNTLSVSQLESVDTATVRLVAGILSEFDRKFDEGSYGGQCIQAVGRHELRMVLGAVDSKVPVDSVGGIMSAGEVILRLRMGARSIQLASFLHLYGHRSLEALFADLLT